MSLQTLKTLAAILVALVGLGAGLYPYLSRWRGRVEAFPSSEALAAGVFFGAGLIHMLGDAASDFDAFGTGYPIAFLIAGLSYLAFLLMEHLGREVQSHTAADQADTRLALIAFVMLSMHSAIVGTALGIDNTVSAVLILMLAVVAHKWAAAFSLAVTLTRSSLPSRVSLSLFLVFVCMTPTGIFFGEALDAWLSQNPYVEPVFNAFAAGTFLYLGTLHGLAHSPMVKQCCDLRQFGLVLAGFSLMALVAIWM